METEKLNLIIAIYIYVKKFTINGYCSRLSEIWSYGNMSPAFLTDGVGSRDNGVSHLLANSEPESKAHSERKFLGTIQLRHQSHEYRP